MGLETGTYISDLNSANPLGTDLKSAGDDHLRLIKSTILATFANVTGAVTSTHTELNYVDVTTLGTVQASKAVTADASGNINLGTGNLTNGGTAAFGALTCTALTSTGIDDNASSTAVTIDESGNLLVGTTTSSTSVSGHSLLGGIYNGIARHIADGIEALQVGRLNSDGALVKFYKDGSTVGNIGTSGGELYIDFGGSTGGNVSSRTLDDYEEGTWTPSLGDGTNNATLTTANGRYTKIGNQVTVHVGIYYTSKGSATGDIRIYGLPFTPNSDFTGNFSHSAGAIRGYGAGLSTPHNCITGGSYLFFVSSSAILTFGSLNNAGAFFGTITYRTTS